MSISSNKEIITDEILKHYKTLSSEVLSSKEDFIICYNKNYISQHNKKPVTLYRNISNNSFAIKENILYNGLSTFILHKFLLLIFIFYN